MRRHLLFSEASGALRMGRTVEQFLRVLPDGDDRIIEWLYIHRERRTEEFRVVFLRVFDEGCEHFNVLIEFQPCDPDLPDGVQKCFSEPDAALAYAVEELGADRERFVNSQMAQAEYGDYIAKVGWVPRRA